MSLPFIITLGCLCCCLLFESKRQRPDNDFDIRFGIIEMDEAGQFDVSRETTKIPLLYRETGFCFGYSIDPPYRQIYTTYEIIYLPAPPLHIDFPLPIEKKNGGRVIKTPNIVRDDHMIYPYSFSDGDPLGTWRLEIFINNELARMIRFSVVPPWYGAWPTNKSIQ